jgi:hyperosmotically inducible periplasmic protein
MDKQVWEKENHQIGSDDLVQDGDHKRTRKVNKMRKFKTNFAVLLAALVIGLAPQALVAKSVSSSANDGPGSAQLAKKVRSKLVTLPYYGVFDNLAYSIDGGRVTLHGQVVRPSTRSDAERSVARIEGVTQVVNKIKVLPLSGFDDSVRRNTYRALSRSGGLYRYFMGTNPSIHIIVDRGHVTLVGTVNTRMDSQLAYVAANGVSGAFSVTNNLQVEGQNDAR